MSSPLGEVLTAQLAIGISSNSYTNGGLAELLVGHLVGDVGPHKHTHFDAKLLADDVRYQLQTIGSFIHTLGFNRT